MTTVLTPSPKQKFFTNNGALLNNGKFTLFVFSFVSCLLCSSSPAPISWFIISIIIYSVYCQSWGISRAFSHVSKEICKFMPSLTYRNASSAIIDICRNFRIVASTHDRPPNAIILSLTQSMSCRPKANSCPASSTSTRTTISASKIARPNINSIATTALTMPLSRNFPTSSNFMNCSEIAKFFTREYWSLHSCNYTGTITK